MRNLTLMTDLYQLTMMYGYQKSGTRDQIAVFDMFFRDKEELNFSIMAGVEQLVDYIQNLHFSDDDLEYLRSTNLFDEEFLGALRDFHFSGDVYCVPEGTVVFSGEPLIRVVAPVFEAQLIETALLNIINHQTLIATKACRVCRAAGDTSVLEFGLRRAQGPDAGIYGARAAIIGGCTSTSNVLVGKMFDVPIAGTHAHSWVMSFPDELTAFRKYAEFFPDSCLLLVDTFDTLKSGIPNAITVFNELRAAGHEPRGIRLDSGDLAYLTKEARRMLDDAGFPNAKICVSGDLDETLIQSLRMQGACIDIWGVGTKMITSENTPSLGGVYKLCAMLEDGVFVPKIKISENPVKVTNPGLKMLYRIYDNESGKALADLIALDDEEFDTTQPLEIFDPINTWKRKTVTNYHMRKLLEPLFIKGEFVGEKRKLLDIQAYCQQELNTFWDQYRRLIYPQRYKIDLSEKLWFLKQNLLEKHHKR